MIVYRAGPRDVVAGGGGGGALKVVDLNQAVKVWGSMRGGLTPSHCRGVRGASPGFFLKNLCI